MSTRRNRRNRNRKNANQETGISLDMEHPVNRTVHSIATAFDLTPGAAALYGTLLLSGNSVTQQQLADLQVSPTLFSWDLPELIGKGLVEANDPASGKIWVTVIEDGERTMYPAPEKHSGKTPANPDVRNAALGIARAIRRFERDCKPHIAADPFFRARIRELKKRHRDAYKQAKQDLVAVDNQLRWLWTRFAHRSGLMNAFPES